MTLTFVTRSYQGHVNHCVTLDVEYLGNIHTYIHTFIIEWQHKHAGFKTKHNAQSISQ